MRGLNNLKNSLCWYCDNAYGGCEWAQEFKPVEGWNAEPTEIKDKTRDTTISSYNVKSCPKFIPDEKFTKKDGRH